jgi:AcrR family transcriptional regulator
MGDIAAEAGVTKVVLYRYFGDKGGLYQAVAERYVRELMDKLRAALSEARDPAERLRATVGAYVVFIEGHHEKYDFLMHRAIREGPEAQATVADFMRGVAHEVGEVLADEIARAGFDPAPSLAWAHGLVGMVHFATDWWLTDQTVSRDQLVDDLVTLVSRGLFGATTGLPRTGERSDRPAS